jgi:hypothetical protein
VSPILGIIASSKFAAVGDFESIATVSVGSGGAASAEFTSIPATYTHLQIRYLNKSTAAGSGVQTDSIQLGNGSIDTGSNYSLHLIEADGSSVAAGSGVNQTRMYSGNSISSGATNVFAVSVIDILDYANTNKYKTIRLLSGVDNNGSGVVTFHSGSWRNTAAITNIKLFSASGNIAQYSQFALYGIKGA